MLNVAINGLGRIGRATLKIVLDKPGLRLTAVNDVLAADNLAYLLRFDTVYGRWTRDVKAHEKGLNIEGKNYPVLGERDPAKLPWRQMGVDVVFECTGAFRERNDLAKHIEAGARFVILSAPAKGEDVPTVIHAVNRSARNPAQIVSCASCTTNCITPVVVCPGRPQVIALPPEYIMPQDGHEKQDCAQVAGKRWLLKHAATFAPARVTLLGDALYSKQPFCALALAQGYNFILVCKPDSHPTLYERLAFWQANAGIATREDRRWHGRYAEVSSYRWCNDVLLLDGKEPLRVNWCEITVVHAKTGARLYHNSFITNHRITADNVAAVTQAGRGRWKIENENNNVLKTKGYHIEHNFGHGQQYLAAVMLSLNLLAFLFHTVLEWRDDKYALLRQVLARRQTFFDDIRALTRYMIFDSWEHVLDFMLQGLDLQASLDTS